MDAAQNVFAILSVSNLVRSAEDDLVSLFFALGAEGVSEDLSFSQQDLCYEPEVRETERMTLNVYFTKIPTEQDRLEWVERIHAMAPDAQVGIRVEANRDWLEEWKKGFKPFAFAEPFWVVPRWLEIPAHLHSHPEHVLLMEPGMAFGTGTHETTRLAAGLVVKTMQPGWSVLDVGTGTGILALICERLGCSMALGNDIDPEARRTARENLELNRAVKAEIDDRDLATIVNAQTTGRFDLVIANIIDGVLVTLAADLARALKVGGTLVLSGILVEREEAFHREFARLSGCRECLRVRDGEWCASLWQKT